jgi:ATP-dependent Zn protease
VKVINDRFEKDMTQLLKSKWECVVRIAEHLLERKEIVKDEIDKILKGHAKPL